MKGNYISISGRKYKLFYYKDGESRKLDDMDIDLAVFLAEVAKGKENIINSRILFDRYGPSSGIRKRVHRLRLAGYPICSNTNGYYWADTSDELAETYMFLKSYIDELNQVAAGILDCYIEKRFGKKSE